MKKNITLCLLATLFSLSVFSQEKVERYCSVFVPYRINITKDNIVTIDLGENIGFSTYKDTALVRKLKKISSSKNLIEALNYISSFGWKIFSSQLTTNYNPVPAGYFFIFKKEFDKSEIVSE